MIGVVRINGVVSDGMVSVTDSSVLRGDGCFEVLKCYDGKPFALEDHLARLQKSATLLDIALPAADLIGQWVTLAAAEGGDCAVRVIVTRGSALPGVSPDTNVIVFAHEWAGERRTRLKSVSAPWHSAGVEWELAGAKILSYAPNMSATRTAKAAGYDDALLVTPDGWILEGPTFSVAWVVDGVLETPSLDLGILDSITRRVVLEIATENDIPVREDRWQVSRLGSALELVTLSTIGEVQPIHAVDDKPFQVGPVGDQLAEAYSDRIGSKGVRHKD